MIEITSDQHLNEFFRQEHAIMFFHAPWSQYAVISKQMMEFMERYADMSKQDVRFFYGQFENESIPLGEALVAAGVPPIVAFTGNGSLSIFRRGQHIHTLSSVIGEGMYAVWKHIDELLNNPEA